MNRWWRFDNDAHNNPKLLRLSDEMFRAWTVLLSLASKNGGVLPPADDMALTLRMKPTKVAEWITRLTKAELLDNNDGVFSPHNWTTRQYVSDDSSERVRKHRNKKRNAPNVTECNVSSSVTETVSVTPPEQKQSRTDSEQSRADAGALVDEDLKRRAAAIAAGISAHFLSRQMPLPNMERCTTWLQQGYAQGTILAAVEAVLKRPNVRPATLDYFDGAIRDAHAKAAPTGTPIEVTNKVFVEVGTPEWAAWNHHSRSIGGRGFHITQHRVGNSLRDGFWFATRVPDGYDEATGEKLETSEERVA